MVNLNTNLLLDRCPHCSVANPNLFRQHHLETRDHAGGNVRHWFIYSCGRCGGVVSAWASKPGAAVGAHFPSTKMVHEDIPEKPRTYLQQAVESLHAPAGAVMLAASAVDAMLKIKGYTDGSLYARIEKASAEHVITKDMAQWAHDVRLDANDQRHSDESANLPSAEEATKSIEFATALAEILFVLPARVRRGLKQAQTQTQDS